MREVKDEANRTSPPLFPRLHVNDTEKGGRSPPPPRAPVALHQQWSVRPQSHVSDSPSTLSISPDTTSFSRGAACVAGKREKNLFIPFRDVATPSEFADKQNSSSLSVGKCSITVDSLDGKVKKGLNYPTLRGSLSSVTKPKSSEKNEYRFKNFSFKNLSSLDYLKVPVVGCSETDLRWENDPQASTDLSLQLHTSSKNAAEGAAVLGRSCGYLRNQHIDNATMQPLKPETAHRHELVVGVHSHEDVSDSSGMDSASGLSASPDHVVKVIRDKQCSKMRTAMIDQQRIFAAQVFELHRLITVQKTLARSPNTLLEGKCNTGKPGTTKKFSLVPQMTPKVKPNTEEPKPSPDSLEKRIIPKLPLPSLSKELVTQPFHPTATNGQPSNPWWFSAPGNHWLVPVVSPSEGLVYKPYAGPRPPTSGFVVPIFGNDSFETALRFPVPHQFSHSYFPPNTTPHPSPLGHISQGMPFSIRTPEASKDSEVQGSSASSPAERRKPDVLPLFPTEPTCLEAKPDEHKQHPPLHAIKAVPHNPKSASESAARIFRLIQEERKH